LGQSNDVQERSHFNAFCFLALNLNVDMEQTAYILHSEKKTFGLIKAMLEICKELQTIGSVIF